MAVAVYTRLRFIFRRHNKTRLRRSRAMMILQLFDYRLPVILSYVAPVLPGSVACRWWVGKYRDGTRTNDDIIIIVVISVLKGAHNNL